MTAVGERDNEAKGCRSEYQAGPSNCNLISEMTIKYRHILPTHKNVMSLKKRRGAFEHIHLLYNVHSCVAFKMQFLRGVV